MKRIKNNLGFTILELIIAIGLLGAISIGTGAYISNSFKDSNKLGTKVEIQTSVTALMNKLETVIKTSDIPVFNNVTEGQIIKNDSFEINQLKQGIVSPVKFEYIDKKVVAEGIEYSYIDEIEIVAYKNGAQIKIIGEGNKYSLTSTFYTRNTIGYQEIIDKTGLNMMLAEGSSWYDDDKISKSSIEKIILENNYTPLGTEIAEWEADIDFSGDVMCYVTSDYELIITGKSEGRIYANEDSSYAFSGFTSVTSIEGLELLSTTNVKNMSNMFYNVNSLSELELINFDTTNVTNMDEIFGMTELDQITLGTKFKFDGTNHGLGSSTWYLLDGTQVEIELYQSTSTQTTTYYATNPVSTYVVNHYLENANNTDYTLYTTETKTAEGNTITLADEAITISNATYKEGKLGSTVATTASVSYANTLGINLYYTRNTYTLTLQNNGIIASEIDYKYGANVQINASVASGYTWSGWYYTDNSLYSSSQSTTITIPANAVTLNAVSTIQMGPTIFAAGSSWYKGITDKATIQQIEILASYEPAGTVTENWNADINNSGSIKCYIEGTTLKIAGNGTTIYANEIAGNMFNGFSSVKSISGLSNINTSNVTNMAQMFIDCSSLTSLDLSNFDTSAVTSMNGMFWDCSSLASLDISSFDISNVISMYAMFSNCSSLNSLDLSNFDTANVTDMSYMFYNCSSLSSLDLSNFDTSAVTSMTEIFSTCSNLTSVNVNNFDTSNVTNMMYMFFSCSKLANVNVSNFDTSAVTDMNGMFQYCSSLASLDISNFDTSAVTDMDYMFYEMNKLQEVTLGTTFSFVGNASRLPTPSSEYIDDADGNWYTEDGTALTSAEVAEETRTEPTTYYAVQSVQYTLTYDANGGSGSVAGQTVIAGQSVALRTNSFVSPSTNATFGGWITSATATSATYSAGATITPTGNMTLYAFWKCNCCSQNFKTCSCTNFECSSCDDCTKHYPLCESCGTCLGYHGCAHKCSSCKGYTEEKCDDCGCCANCCECVIEAPTMASGSDWYKGSASSVPTITQIDIVSSYTPAGTPSESWNADVGNTGAVKCYIEGTKLTIAGNGADTIKLGSDASYFFGFGDYVEVEQFASLTTINGLGMLDTSNVTNMEYMFFYCDALTSVDLSGFDTSNVTNMGCMFTYCYALTSVTFGSNFDTSNVTDMRAMFEYCSSLTTINGLTYFNTSSVTNMNGMFDGCYDLTSLDLSSFNTSNVINMAGMFSECGVTQLTLGANFRFCSGEDAGIKKSWYLEDAMLVEDIILYQSNINKTTTYYESVSPTLATKATWYKGTTDKSTIVQIKLVDSYTPTGTVAESWNADELNNGSIKCYIEDTNLTIVGNKSGKILANSDSSNAFSEFLNVTEISGLTILDTKVVTNMEAMFWKCEKLQSLNISNFNTSNVTNMQSIFSWCKSLTSLNISNFNTSKVTNMSSVFNLCLGLESIIGLDKLDTSSVTDVFRMFAECDSLTSLDLRTFNTSSVTHFDSMFYGCDALTSLNLSSFDTSKADGSMGAMFYGCSSLSSLDLSNFNTSNVIYTAQMFAYCESLTSLDLSNFNTSKVEWLTEMFLGCSNLTTLDLSSFNTSNVTQAYDTFDGCIKLQQVTLSENFKGDGLKFCTLPTPSSEYITGATGSWYTKDGTEYAPSDVALATRTGITTYYAVPQ